jgi:hypothetical protein
LGGERVEVKRDFDADAKTIRDDVIRMLSARA